MISNPKITPSLLICLLLVHPLPFVYASQELPAAFAEDISDRKYLPKVLELIGGAKEAVDVSMFAVGIGSASDPGSQLLSALETAAESGKKVRLWLNARQASVGSSYVFMRPDIQEGLEKKGILIFYVDPKIRLHDKLIVIDREIVIEGSMNWTREALLKNFESAAIIHSAELAAIKIKRLESFPVMKKRTDQETLETEGSSFSFPIILLKDPNLFPAALEANEVRTLALYLLLLEQTSRTGQTSLSLTLNLETLGEKLPFKKRWIGNSLRHEMRRNLDFLSTRYSLLDWKETERGAAQIILKPVVSSEHVWVPEVFIASGYLKSLSASALFVYLVTRHKAQLSANVPFQLGSIDDVAWEFHLSPVTLIRGLWDLKRANLVEIFPSEKKLVDGKWQREFTNRYLLNPILSPEARAQRLDSLRKQFGTDLVDKAVQLADSIDEPEDPEIVRQFIRFLKRYSESKVERAVGIVAGFNRNNVLRTPAYIRGILEAGEA